MFEDDFAKRLAFLREQRGVSAREMSLAIGQNESYINRIENKKTFPSMQSFFYICEYLQITPKDFFDTQNPEPTAIRDITDALCDLTSEQLDLILRILEQFRQK